MPAYTTLISLRSAEPKQVMRGNQTSQLSVIFTTSELAASKREV
jgi:hypothetical protein